LPAPLRVAGVETVVLLDLARPRARNLNILAYILDLSSCQLCLRDI
jgi:hypothetical protein